MPGFQVTVFGGTGFLGRAVVRACLAAGHTVRVASRRPEIGWQCTGGPDGGLQFVRADIVSGGGTAAAVAGADAVVNAVGLYVENGAASFRAVHVEAAERLARLSREAGVARFVHVSGIGADRLSRSRYIRSRGLGEAAVAAAFPGAALVRPAAMFGPGDALLGGLVRILRRAPVFPLFGTGGTRLQPVHVADVAAAIASLAARPLPLSELGGPEILTYRALVERICRRLDRRPLLLPLPFALWQLLAAAAERLPRPPIGQGQVQLMRRDTVASPDLPGLRELGIAPTSVGQGLTQLLGPAAQPAARPRRQPA